MWVVFIIKNSSIFDFAELINQFGSKEPLKVIHDYIYSRYLKSYLIKIQVVFGLQVANMKYFIDRFAMSGNINNVKSFLCYL